MDILKAKEILDEDHYGLKKVKDRILDYLSVRRLKPDMKGPILCFVGPPGVGKTSLGRSIARALGRKFSRISLGGMHDEAEIRGHRRTYIGALPGQIIQHLKRVEVKDPVFMLDEIDKLGRDFRGDPASALLETLDPEQNNTFRDNYLDQPFDLSKVLFICTANQLDTIPGPLLDRMEIIELTGYTEEEKVNIAIKYLIPRQIKENGITAEQIEFPMESVHLIARHYTREAGVRKLEQQIGTVCRKVARRIAEGTDGEGRDYAGGGARVPGRHQGARGYGDCGADQARWRCGWAGVDSGGRRCAVHRGEQDEGQGRLHDHRADRRCDEGEHAGCADVGAVECGVAGSG